MKDKDKRRSVEEKGAGSWWSGQDLFCDLWQLPPGRLPAYALYVAMVSPRAIPHALAQPRPLPLGSVHRSAASAPRRPPRRAEHTAHVYYAVLAAHLAAPSLGQAARNAHCLTATIIAHPRHQATTTLPVHAAPSCCARIVHNSSFIFDDILQLDVLAHLSTACPLGCSSQALNLCVYDLSRPIPRQPSHFDLDTPCSPSVHIAIAPCQS